MQFSLSGSLATMANGLPYSIGAAVAYPGRQVVCVVGDGGLTMLMGELATLVKYKLRVKVIVIKNNVLGQIKWEQMILEGNPEFGVELQPIDFAKVAEACGAARLTPSSGRKMPNEFFARHCGTTALSSSRPSSIPTNRRCPARSPRSRRIKFAKSLLRGQKDAAKIIKTVRKTRFARWFKADDRLTQQLSLQSPMHDLEIVRNRYPRRPISAQPFLLTAASSLMSGLEVAYEHYRGSYSRRVMYTPVILSAALAGAGVAGFFSRRAARTVLRAVSAITLVDAAVGFYFHVRGIQRKPGGWRLPMTNMIMGPPIFAPLLFGTSAYLGLIASYLQREDSPTYSNSASPDDSIRLARSRASAKASRELLSAEQDIREGRFQRQVAIVTGISALLSGFEAYYSHYKNNFRYKVQWTPVILAPLLAAAAFGAVKSRKVATTALPALSVVACADAAVGFFYHARGVLRRPGGTQASRLQHHVRAADLRAAALRRRRNARHSGQPAADGEDDERQIAKHIVEEPIPLFSRSIPIPVKPCLRARSPATIPASAPCRNRLSGTQPRAKSSPSASAIIRLLRFFTADEAKFWGAVFDHLIPQTDRTFRSPHSDPPCTG